MDILDRNNRYRVACRTLLLRALEAPHRPEALRVVLLRVVEHRLGVRLLDLVTHEQYLDHVGHLRDHGEIVGDVDRGRIELVDDVADCREDFDLRRYVKRGRGLVEDDQVGTAGHGHGGHRPLQLPTRYLVRIAEADLAGIG